MGLLSTIPQALIDGLILCAKITAIVAPLLVGYEIAKAYRVFQRPWSAVRPLLKRLGLGPSAMVPLLAGTFLGLFYGAGILISQSDEEGLAAGERLALAVFLVTCHAVIEDVALFVLLGGSAFWMLAPRVVLAVGLCAALARGSRSQSESGDGAFHE